MDKFDFIISNEDVPNDSGIIKVISCVLSSDQQKFDILTDDKCLRLQGKLYNDEPQQLANTAPEIVNPIFNLPRQLLTVINCQKSQDYNACYVESNTTYITDVMFNEIESDVASFDISVDHVEVDDSSRFTTDNETESTAPGSTIVTPLIMFEHRLPNNRMIDRREIYEQPNIIQAVMDQLSFQSLSFENKLFCTLLKAQRPRRQFVFNDYDIFHISEMISALEAYDLQCEMIMLHPQALANFMKSGDNNLFPMTGTFPNVIFGINCCTSHYIERNECYVLSDKRYLGGLCLADDIAFFNHEDFEMQRILVYAMERFGMYVSNNFTRCRING